MSRLLEGREGQMDRHLPTEPLYLICLMKKMLYEDGELSAALVIFS